MPLTMNPQTAWVFDHDSTWDYICRHCMTKGDAVSMETFKDYSGVWIKCPKCGVRERIDVK